MRTEAKIMSAEEYIQYELKSERRHEYIEGNLYEIPGEKKINNQIAFAIALLLHQQLFPEYRIYNHDVKVAIPGGTKFYYPDVCISAEQDNNTNQYIVSSPAIIVEVVSENSQTHDYVDKYLDYIKIPSLQYYIIAEPETILITVYERGGEAWIAHKYTGMDARIELAQLNISLPLADIYKGISFS